MDYIGTGGFPELQRIRNKRGYIESLISAILEKDIKRRFKILNVDVLRKIAKHLFNNACQEITYYAQQYRNPSGTVPYIFLRILLM